ncbi:hypothetical protein [Bacillus massiliigorillae]|uniref:hypothetical protein n=1 Tax=Bacillus massiliigorillae TaxID=1243664 RepID=UPI00039D26E9|nr:hypothetical protein [Bacillus massiliigorillae]
MGYALIVLGLAVIVTSLVYYYKDYKKEYKESYQQGGFKEATFCLFNFVCDIMSGVSFLTLYLLIGLGLIVLGLDVELNILS